MAEIPEYDWGLPGFGAGFSDQDWAPKGTTTDDEIRKADEQLEKENRLPANKLHRRSELFELSLKYEYRRAYSETRLLDMMRKFEFREGYSYNFISSGDVDSLSYLKAILRSQDLEYCLASTWCMGAEDVLQFRDWVREGRLKKLDMYVGEIFSTVYKIESEMIERMYREFPDLGRYVQFRNHSKIFAGYGEKFAFVIQSSANINTNPRAENTVITIDRGLYEFYRKHFDGIMPYIKAKEARTDLHK